MKTVQYTVRLQLVPHREHSSFPQ